MTEKEYKFILDRVIENALESIKQSDGDDFSKGKKMACYEFLDIIKNEVEVRGESITEFGIPKNLEKLIFK